MKKLMFLVLMAQSVLGAVAVADTPADPHLFSLETQFYKVFSSNAPENFLTDEIDAILFARYRAHGSAYEQINLVHELATRKNMVPINPSTLDPYVHARAYSQVGEEIADEFRYNYERLLQVMNHPGSTANDQLKALASLNQVDLHIAKLDASDQAELKELIVGMQEARLSDPTKPAKILLPVPKDQIKPVARGKGFPKTKKEKVFSEKELAERLKKIQAKIARANTLVDKKLPAALEQQQANVGPAMTVFPSEGEAGNFTGYHMPEGYVALTFDDGPVVITEPDGTKIPTTQMLVESLVHHRDRINTRGAPASFFWLGFNVQFFGSIVDQVLAENRNAGFELFSTNCHSWHHSDLTKVSGATYDKEVFHAIQTEELKYGHPMKFFRCPGGACSKRVRADLAKKGIVHAGWSIDSLDWLLRDEYATFRYVTEQLKISGRGVVLMHDIHPESVTAAQMILDWIKEQNDSPDSDLSLQLVTIDEAVNLQNQAVQTLTSSR